MSTKKEKRKKGISVELKERRVEQVGVESRKARASHVWKAPWGAGWVPVSPAERQLLPMYGNRRGEQVAVS
jgi:hypothetical protein